ncbi:hypothetical protein E3N88_26178 [Mikania micrantha]|uniref:Ubiquitin-like protease family profile domain-containing protein n=1 Tax=Mikania micrantha TaxID=192012 RepID=A0A5N6N6U5_9ASTR|nr:hypothetical protein E3N88_26178 [Mikania micrantha]
MIGRQLYTSVVDSWVVVLNFEERKEAQTHHIDYSVIPNVAVTIIDNMVEEDSLVGLKDDTDFFEKDASFKVVPVKLKLPWATKKNVTDCGVFVMRHMEMYMGKEAKSFDCGFSKNHFKRTSQIKTLRKKYATRILLSDANNLKHVVIERAF